MEREKLQYIPFRRAWYKLSKAKDTPEKRLAFFDAIFDYAFNGIEIPEPEDTIDPKGVDYAKFDGFIVAKDQLDFILPRIIGGSTGGESKARYGNQNAKKNKKEKTQNATETQVKTQLKRNIIKENNNSNNKLIVSSNNIISNKLIERENIARACEEYLKSHADGKNLNVILPTIDDMFIIATQVQVPFEYLPTFLDEIHDGGWGYVNPGGNYVALNKFNFQAILKAFYKQDLKGGKNGNTRKCCSDNYTEGLAEKVGF